MSTPGLSFTVNGTNTEYSRWEDVKSYTSVIITIKSTVASTGICTLHWGNSTDDDVPSDISSNISDSIATDSIELYGIITRQFDVKARWLKLIVQNTGGVTTVATTYKKTPTELQLHDASYSLAAVTGGENNNMLQTHLTDSSGAIISSTGIDGAIGRALRIHMADASAGSLEASGSTLSVSIRDSSNNPIDTTGKGTDAAFRDVQSFPPTDIVVLLDRSYSMKETVDSGHSYYYVAFNSVLQSIIDKVNTENGFQDNKTRVVIASYARIDVSCADASLNQNLDSVADYHRTIEPGAIEISGTDWFTLNDFINTAKGRIEEASGNDTRHPGGNAGDTYYYVPKTDNGGMYNFPYNGTSGRVLLHPGTAIYSTIERMFTVCGDVTESTALSQVPDASGVGNVGRIVDREGDGLSDYTQFIVPQAGKRKILINITDGGITDDKISRSVYPYGYNASTHDNSLGDRIYDSAHHKLKTLFGSEIYNFNIAHPPLSANKQTDDAKKRQKVARFIDPCNRTIETAGTAEDYYANQLGKRIFEVQSNETADIELQINNLLGQALDVPFYGNNAMLAAPVDSCGTHQASTKVVQDAYFEGRALFYSLSDKSGSQLSTIVNISGSDASANALHVHGVHSGGAAISSNNGLHVQYASEVQKTVVMFDASFDASISTITDISNHTFTLRHVGIANETPVTVWTKIYDISTGKNTNPADVTGKPVKMNIAVPGLGYRDINLSTGIKFNNGFHVRASTDYPPESPYEDVGGALYIHGSYTDATEN